MKQFVLAFLWQFRMLSKKCVLAMILPCFYVGILNAFSLQDLQANIQQVLKGKTLQGKFTQEKELKGFSNVIKSFGSFRLIDSSNDSTQNNGEKVLFWEIKSPITSSLKITPKGIFEKAEKQDSQNETKWIARNTQHQEMLLEILSADFDGLKKYFVFSFAEQNGAWNLTLKPKNALIAKVFDSIILEGLSNPSVIQKVILRETNGDKTTNTFSAIIIK